MAKTPVEGEKGSHTRVECEVAPKKDSPPCRLGLQGRDSDPWSLAPLMRASACLS